MRAFSSTDANLTAEYGIEIGRWEQYPGTAGFPFNVMWCVFPAAQQSARPASEHELAVVVSGHARFLGRPGGSDSADRRAGRPLLDGLV